MPLWSHYNPVHMHAGAGAREQLREVASSWRWLLVTTAGFTRRGMTRRILAMQGEQRLAVFDEVTPNPDLDHLERTTRIFRGESIDVAIAVGGGSVIDAAKVLAVTLQSQSATPLTDTLRAGKPQSWANKLLLIPIPTTSGTGAH